ncbi:uncharacterized protein [Diadema setosum]|uniref:uncharacterized protein n=1 Tax=Diadema setosum TaxID=31175 RepID=UPI003B3B9077
MNWVGGARNRLKMKNDKRRQKEFFERQRYSSKVKRMEDAGSPSKKKQAVSLDILSLQAANLSAAKFQRTSNAKKSTRVNHVNLDKSRGMFGQKFVDLPDASPEGKPSNLALCRPSPTAGVSVQGKPSPPYSRHPLSAIPESQENAGCSVVNDFNTSIGSSRSLHSLRNWTQSPITPWHTGTLGLCGSVPSKEFGRRQITSSRQITASDGEPPCSSHCTSEDVLSFNCAKGTKTATKEEFLPHTSPMTPGSGTSEFSSISHVSYTHEVTADEATVPSVNSFAWDSVSECTWKEKSPSPAHSLGTEVQSSNWSAESGCKSMLPPADSSFSSFKDYHRISLAGDQEPARRPAGGLLHWQSGVTAGQQPVDLTCSESARFTSPEDSPRRHPCPVAVDDRLSETSGPELQRQSDDKDKLLYKRTHTWPRSWQHPHLEDVIQMQHPPEHSKPLYHQQMDCQRNPPKPVKVLELCAAQTSSACPHAASTETGRLQGLSRRDIIELERAGCCENRPSEEDVDSCRSSDCTSSEAISSDEDTDSHLSDDGSGKNWLAFVRGSHTPKQGQHMTTTLCSRSAIELQPGRQSAKVAASSAKQMLDKILELDRELQKSKERDSMAPLQITDSTDIGVEKMSGNGTPQGSRNDGTAKPNARRHCSYSSGEMERETEKGKSRPNKSSVRVDICHDEADEATSEVMRSKEHHADDYSPREPFVGSGAEQAIPIQPGLQDKGCVFTAATPDKDAVSGGKACCAGDIGREEMKASRCTQTELWDAGKVCHIQADRGISFQENSAQTNDSMATQTPRQAESGTQTKTSSCNYSRTHSCTQTGDGLWESCTLPSGKAEQCNACTQTNNVKLKEGSTQTEGAMSSSGSPVAGRQEESFLSPSVPTSTSASDDLIHRADGKFVSDVAVHCTLIGSPIIGEGCETSVFSTTSCATDPLSSSVQDMASSQDTEEYNSCQST